MDQVRGGSRGRGRAAARSGPRPTTVRTRPPAVRTVPSASRAVPAVEDERAASPRPRRGPRSRRRAAARPGSRRRPGRSRPTRRGGVGRRPPGSPDAPSAGAEVAARRRQQDRPERRRRAAAGSPASRGRRSARCTRAGPGRPSVSIRPAYSAPRNGVPRRASSARIGRWKRSSRSRRRPRRAGPGAGCRRPSRRCSGPRRRRAVACGRGPAAARPPSRPSQSAMRLASRPIEPLLDDDPVAVRGSARRAPRSSAIARSASVERVAHRHALAGRQPVGLDHDAAARPPPARRRTRSPRPRRANAPARAIGTPAAAATSWQNALLDSIRAAAAVGPKTAIPASIERVGDAGRQRRLGPDDDQLGGLAPGDRDDRRRVERIDARHAADTRLARDRVAPRRDDDLVDARLGGQLPGERVLAPAAAHDEDPGRHHRGSRRQPRAVAHRPPGPLDRLGPLRPDRHEHDRDAGVLLDAPTRSAGRSRAGRPASGRR